MEIVVDHLGELHRAKVGDLSCGGALLLCDVASDVGVSFTLNLANVTRGQGLLPTEGEVVWAGDAGRGVGTFRHRMGIQFVDLGAAEQRSLDTLVVDSLENKLLSLSRDALDGDFLRRESIAL